MKLLVEKEFDLLGEEFLKVSSSPVEIDQCGDEVRLTVEESNGDIVCYTIPKKALV